MKSTSSNGGREGEDTQESSGLAFTGLLGCLSHPYLSPWISRGAQSTCPTLGLGSTAPNTGRTKRFYPAWQEIKEKQVCVGQPRALGQRIPTSE